MTEIEALRAALDGLRPFANMATWIDCDGRRRDAIYGTMGLICEVTQRDCHAAAALIVLIEETLNGK